MNVQILQSSPVYHHITWTRGPTSYLMSLSQGWFHQLISQIEERSF